MIRRLSWIALAAALILIVADAAAEPVDNPGPFTLTLTGGTFTIGTNQVPVAIDPINPPTLSGSVDGGGNVTLPQSGISFPPVTLNTPLGPIGVLVQATGDGSGTLNAATGVLTANLSFQVYLNSPALPTGCGVGPIATTVTTATSGSLTGVPYDQGQGTATVVDNTLTVPNSSGCDPLGTAIDGFIGLPAGAGVNSIQLIAQFNPIFTGSTAVANPGSFTLTLTGNPGSFVVGTNAVQLNVDPTNPPTLAGSVDIYGNVSLPQSGISFPNTTLSTPLGPVTVQIQAIADGSGFLDPATGVATATVALQIGLLSPALPSGCGIGPVTVSVTTGTDGALTGVPYNATTGTATFVNNSFTAPNSSGCDPLGPAIDGFIGLPAGAGANSANLSAQFNPVFVSVCNPVLNPSGFLLTLTGNPGTFTIGTNGQQLSVDPANPPMFAGSVNANGDLIFPQAGISFPDTMLPSPLGPVTVHIVAANDGGGLLNPATGALSATVDLNIELINPALPSTCAIGPVTVAVTSGTDGALTGVAYSPSNGAATVVSNSFAVPGSSGCDPLGGAVDALIGLPAGAGVNSANLSVQFNPVFVPSCP